MDWEAILERLRRFIRDPDGNIWSDAEILRFWNIEQVEFQRDFGELEDMTIVRIPPHFQMTFFYDWEWPYTESADGYLNTCISDKNFYDQSQYVFTHRWEPLQLAGSTTLISDLGTFFTHPWEAWMVDTTPADSPPVWVADKFHKIMFVAFNRKMLKSQSEKEVIESDRTWRTRAGEPVIYWENESLENYIHIFPLPSSVTWDDATLEAMVIAGVGATAESDEGTVIDVTGAFTGVDDGITTDMLDEDDNLFVAYKKIPRAVEATDDVPDFPSFMLKYIEYGTLERLYSANSEGKIDSLRDYWAYRKLTAKRIIQKYRAKSKEDRDYCMKTKGVEKTARSRHARLPDTYPDVNV